MTPTSSCDLDAVRRTCGISADSVVVLREEAPVRFARVQALRTDGEPRVVGLRTDGDGRTSLARLEPGRWSLVAHDPRRVTCSAPTSVHVAHTRTTHELSLTVPTGELLLRVHTPGPRRVAATTATITGPDGHRVTVPIAHGLARAVGLRPGPHRVEVAPALGRLGAGIDVEVVADTLVTCTAEVPRGGVVVGRVVRGGVPQLAAVVVLLDADGDEIERTRTGSDGNFVLGTGLGSSRGLTVEATSGPGSLRVTRAAVADVVVLTGTVRDVGDLDLPLAGPDAVWAGRTRAVAGMKLPSTRL